jgi:hypothetical protein
MNYPISVPSLHENFPEYFKPPALLLDFADWLKEKEAGTLGYFRFQSDRFNDFWIENGADLHPYFAFFMRDPMGGQVGYWLHERRATPAPPIVLVGSEGELSIVSNTLEEFLARLADGQTNVPELDSRDDDGGDEGTKLTEWLMSRTGEEPIHSHGKRPDFKQWIDTWGQEQRDWIDNDPFHLQIAEKLRKYVKPNAQPWETANFDVFLVGTQFKMWHRSFGPKPMPPSEVADLESIFRSVREQRARKFPERGLWFTAWVTIGTRGGANLSCNFMDEPKILDERPVVATSDYRIDLATFPRSKYWMPVWLTERTTPSTLRTTP